MPATSELTAAYRRQNLTLRAQTLRDLAKLWPALDWRRLDATYPAWLEGVSTLIGRDRLRAANLAGSYLQAFRMASGIPGEAKILLAGPAPAAQVATVARVTTVVPLKKAAVRGLALSDAMSNAFVLSSGDLTRLVLDAGRDTVRASSVADDSVVGWQRVGRGECDLCQLLLGRGAVYTEATADFETHGHCACTAEPVYR